MTRSEFEKHAMALYDFCEYPAVRYNILYTLLDVPYEDGLWDWGPQTKDPWGYFGYFSCNRHYQQNRVVDGSMEILKFLKKYLDNN